MSPRAARGAARAEGPWWKGGLRFTCTGCGDCCRGPEPGYVEVDAAMIARLAAHMGLEADAFSRRYVRWVASEGKHSLTERPNGDCIFWDDGAGCRVYEARPDQCRTFPFWPEVVESPEAWAEAAEACPGMTDEGRRYRRPEIERILGAADPTRPGVLGRSRGRRLDRAEPARGGRASGRGAGVGGEA